MQNQIVCCKFVATVYCFQIYTFAILLQIHCYYSCRFSSIAKLSKKKILPLQNKFSWSINEMVGINCNSVTNDNFQGICNRLLQLHQLVVLYPWLLHMTNRWESLPMYYCGKLSAYYVSTLTHEITLWAMLHTNYPLVYLWVFSW